MMTYDEMPPSMLISECKHLRKLLATEEKKVRQYQLEVKKLRDRISEMMEPRAEQMNLDILK